MPPGRCVVLWAFSENKPLLYWANVHNTSRGGGRTGGGEGVIVDSYCGGVHVLLLTPKSKLEALN
jgi:hypothetical protein